MDILKELNKRILLFDGGMGTLLQEAGLSAGELPETWNLLHPETVRGIHRDYLAAGADIVTTNTFGANALKYPSSGAYDLAEIVKAAVSLAKDAVREAGHGAVALDLGPTGKLLEPMGELSFEDCVRLYAEVVRIGAAAGADLVLIETMNDMYELKAAVLAAKENSRLPVFASVAFDGRGRLMTGGTPETVTALLEGLRVDVLGMNCSLGPVQMLPSVEKMVRCASIPVMVNPNAGLPRQEGGRTVYDIGPESFADAVEKILDLGVSAVGGCCGTTPEYIRELHARISGRRPPVILPKEETVVTSYCSAVQIGDDPVIVGERINPTGKKRLQAALREADLDYLTDLGFSQMESGAHILDVNVGLPDIREGDMMEATVRELQSVLELPLQIDTSDPAVLERALRIYNGKALINSVNGKQESMDAVFPIAAKYGGVLVALTLDEDGIPADAKGRFRIAEKIVREAQKYGIPKKDLLIDTLCLTISSDPEGAKTTLAALRRVRTELGVGTILGVSNISFGLPQREIVSAAFLTMALDAGLGAAIMNPNSDAMMRSYRAYRALSAKDGNCADYIDAYRDYTPPALKTAPSVPKTGKTDSSAGPPAEGAAGELARCVEQGIKEQAGKAAEEALRSREPLPLIREVMIPALDRVGKGFESGRLFLPQLLMSAEAAKEAFEVIKGAMPEKSAGDSAKRVILATVKGDIHDIGKNIVKVLLENYGFEVLDLGRDVAPERIAAAVKQEGIRLVGLSALMTTTVASMEETIRLLRRETPEVKIIVGGAVLTQEYADQIGADAYGADAMATVAYAQELFGEEGGAL